MSIQKSAYFAQRILIYTRLSCATVHAGAEMDFFDYEFKQEVLQALREILALLKAPSPVKYFNVKENHMSLLPIAPGFSPGFTATPVYASPTNDTPPSASNPVTWTSSDPVNAPITVDASDATGQTATVNIPTTAVVGTSFTLSVSFTNPDGTTATGSASFTIIAAPPSDITSFTISQTS